MFRYTSTSLVLIALGWVLAAPGEAAAQTPGAIQGEVRGARGGGTLQAIAGARVELVGREQTTITDNGGRFHFRDVDPGPVTVSVGLIGYRAIERQVEVTGGETLSLTIELEETAIALDAIVVDVLTGEARRRRELANAVGAIDAREFELAPTFKATDVLTARVAGVMVQQSTGTTGTSAPIRVRGANSLSLSNEPLIIVDGVRFDNSAFYNLPLEGGKPSRLNDLTPEDIESIEVLRGPAASGMYGTAAANGVLVITTKRGRSGDARFSAFSEMGRLAVPGNVLPANYAAATADGAPSGCLLVDAAEGLCVQEAIASFNPLRDSRTTPLQTGARQKYGLSVSGGTDDVTYYISSDLEREDGIYTENTLRRAAVRANLRANLRQNLNVEVSSAYLSSHWTIPPDNWGVYGMLRNSLGGSAFFDENNPDAVYYRFTPRQVNGLIGHQDIGRTTGSITTNWQPLGWLSARATAGVDLVSRHDHSTIEPGLLPIAARHETGIRNSQRANHFNYTVNASATAGFELSDDVSSRTTVGLDYHRDLLEMTTGTGSGLLPGVPSLSASAGFFGVGESTREVITVGYFVQQQIAYRDRIYVTAGLRGDDNSAFGRDFGLMTYPSLGVSWMVSDEEFFPTGDVLSSARVRSSYGRSGLRPAFRQAVTYFQPESVRFEGEDVLGVTIGGTGDPNLRPEKVDEWEAGVDLGLLDDRLSLEMTYFNKNSRDALIARTLPPSLGLTDTRFENLGQVQNSGIEASISAQLVQGRSFDWNSRLSMSTLKNEVLNLGEGVEPIIFQRFTAFLQQHRPGYPAGGWWDRPLSFEDRNGDGIISADEVTVGDSVVFLGRALPSAAISLANNIVIGGRLSLSTLFDARLGHKQLNQTEHRRCLDALARPDTGCQGMWDPDAPLQKQAAFVGFHRYNTMAGYIEDADFVKWRELSLTYSLPQEWLRGWLPVEQLRVTVAGRNLATWTSYTGLDPEVNQGVVDDSPFPMGEYFTPPVARYVTVRIGMGF